MKDGFTMWAANLQLNHPPAAIALVSVYGPPDIQT